MGYKIKHSGQILRVIGDLSVGPWIGDWVRKIANACAVFPRSWAPGSRNPAVESNPAFAVHCESGCAGWLLD
jgi:hypothetical protein